MLHEGSGELHTITGVELIALAPRDARGHLPAERRPDRRRGDAAALRRAGGERARVRRARALPRLLDESAPARSRPALDPLVLSFQLKLLWLSGYLPHVTSCVECGAGAQLVGFSRARGRRGLRRRMRRRRAAALAGGLAGIERLSRHRSPTPRRRALRAGAPRRARRRHLLLRGARRVPAADAVA